LATRDEKRKKKEKKKMTIVWIIKKEEAEETAGVLAFLRIDYFLKDKHLLPPRHGKEAERTQWVVNFKQIFLQMSLFKISFKTTVNDF
jgi:hypothetical protein